MDEPPVEDAPVGCAAPEAYAMRRAFWLNSAKSKPLWRGLRNVSAPVGGSLRYLSAGALGRI